MRIEIPTKLRLKILKENPLCEVCLIFLSEEVHHIIPLSDGGTGVRENLVALCHFCHKYVPGEEPDGYIEEFEVYEKTGGYLWFFFRLGFMAATSVNDPIKSYRQYQKQMKLFQKEIKKRKLQRLNQIQIMMS